MGAFAPCTWPSQAAAPQSSGVDLPEPADCNPTVTLDRVSGRDGYCKVDFRMPYLISLMGLLAGAAIWIWRIRMAREALDEVSGIASDVVSAARRLGFRRRANTHPVESIDEPELAITAIGIAFLDLASLPTAEQLAQLKSALSAQLAVSADKADEMMIVGRWLVNECRGPDRAVERITKRLYQLDKQGFVTLLPVLKTIESDAGGVLSQRQRDALDDIARIMRLK